MFLKEIRLKHFRNYEALSLSFKTNMNLFTGDNAQGKTNILESIYVLALAKSHRTHKDKELIQWNREFALIRGEVENRRGTQRLEIQLTPRGKKAKLAGLEQKKLSEYIGTMNVVMFAPEDLTIVKGSPQQRRRFLDMEIGQVSPAYLYNLANYNKLIGQRNHFLKDLRLHKNFPPEMMDVWDLQLAQTAVKILQKRFRFIRRLQAWADEIHQRITQGKERLTIRYLNSTVIEETMTDEEAVASLLSQLEKVRKKELERGVTLIGPHRDDLAFYVNDVDVQTYGSQGQQRTAALSLKLAEIELIREEVGEYPLLLLDDVLSELDQQRQTQLLEAIRDRVQTFVTSTSVEGIDHRTLQQADRFRVRQGRIEAQAQN
ncbi:DNA replication/repair protein RecF [Bacillaceae bacterium]